MHERLRREKKHEIFLVFLLTGLGWRPDPGTALTGVQGPGAPQPREVTQMHDGRFLTVLVNGVPVVAAPEEIDITNAPELRSALLEAAADGPTLVADMSRTRFCDSSGVHALLAAHKRAQAEGGELLLVVSSDAVLRIFALTGIDHVVPNFTSLDDALAHTSPQRDRAEPSSLVEGDVSHQEA
jgi:anti-sigma B factor antagonist